jgi:hypothetical protein
LFCDELLNVREVAISMTPDSAVTMSAQLVICLVERAKVYVKHTSKRGAKKKAKTATVKNRYGGLNIILT